MDALLLPPSPDPQKSITDPVNLRANDRSENSSDELKDERMRKKMKPSPLIKRKLKAKKKVITNNDEEASSSSCSSSSNLNSTRRVSRVAQRLRNPSVRLGMARRSVGERQAEALALPLGMSFAAFANLVLERKSANGQNVYVDDLAGISASAVKESLANVYGDKLGSFATNFEKSFNSTLKILKLINESASLHQLDSNNVASCDLDRSTIDGCSDSELSAKETSSTMSAYEAIQGGTRTTTTSSMNEIVLHEETRQLSTVSRSSPMPLTTFERALEEQARANDLKSMEIGLTMRKLRLKETELALSYESNNLGKSKLEMNASKAAFRAEKFKTEQEDSKKADMVNKTMDWLVASVVIMLASMLYGAYSFSQQRIMEATSICEPSDEKTSSWWVPKQVSSINAEFNILLCRLRVWVQSFFGVLMILVITYFIIQRSSGAKQTMPVTFIVIFLGIVCGLPGKFCVDTLGGNGKLWLFLWETFCLLQFVANVFTLAFYRLMYGPVTQGGGCNTMVPYWARRSVFFVLIVLALPVMNGLLPFATYGEWKHHWATWWAGL
ncbi:hypothetical protein N665_0510s0002 [Sinapis alba]|nr:hypothetical protein N665_0510s0002 [Sinapis alba]